MLGVTRCVIQMLRSSANVLAAVAYVAVIDFSFVLETRTLRLWPLLEIQGG